MGPERGPIVFLEKSTKLDGQRYRDEIFIPHFLPFYLRMRTKYGPGVVLQEDGAPYHRFSGRKLWIEAGDVQVLPWPSQSPDLSPIENLWREMKHRITLKRHKATSADDFKAVIKEVWEGLDAEVLMKYTNTMYRRLDLIKKAKGGSIKY